MRSTLRAPNDCSTDARCKINNIGNSKPVQLLESEDTLLQMLVEEEVFPWATTSERTVSYCPCGPATWSRFTPIAPSLGAILTTGSRPVLWTVYGRSFDGPEVISVH